MIFWVKFMENTEEIVWNGKAERTAATILFVTAWVFGIIAFGLDELNSVIPATIEIEPFYKLSLIGSITTFFLGIAIMLAQFKWLTIGIIINIFWVSETGLSVVLTAIVFTAIAILLSIQKSEESA